MVLVVCSCFQDVTARPSLSLWCAPPSSSPWRRCPPAASCPWSSFWTLRIAVLQLLVLESLSQSLSMSYLYTHQCSCFSASDLCPLTLSRKWWVLSSLFCSPPLRRIWCTAAPSSSGADSDSGAALPQLGRRLGRLAFAAQPPRGKLSDVYTITTRQSVNNSKTR